MTTEEAALADAIDESILRNMTVCVPYSEAVAEILSVIAEDDADDHDGSTEYWGRFEGEDSHWCIRLAVKP